MTKQSKTLLALEKRVKSFQDARLGQLSGFRKPGSQNRKKGYASRKPRG